MGSAGKFLPDHPFDLSKLIHEIRLGVEPAGRVDQDDIGTSSLRRGQSIEGNGRRVSSVAMSDEFDTDAIRPDLQLINRRSTEGVGGDKERDAASLGKP